MPWLDCTDPIVHRHVLCSTPLLAENVVRKAGLIFDIKTLWGERLWAFTKQLQKCIPCHLIIWLGYTTMRFDLAKVLPSQRMPSSCSGGTSFSHWCVPGGTIPTTRSAAITANAQLAIVLLIVVKTIPPPGWGQEMMIDHFTDET